MESPALLTFDYPTKMAYLELDSCGSDHQRHMEGEGLIVDYDFDGNVIGIEFLQAFDDVWSFAPQAPPREYASVLVAVEDFTKYLQLVVTGRP